MITVALTLGEVVNGAAGTGFGNRLNPDYSWFDATYDLTAPSAGAPPPPLSPPQHVGGPADGPNYALWEESGAPFGSVQTLHAVATGSLPPGVILVQKEVRDLIMPGSFTPWPIGVLNEFGIAGIPTAAGVYTGTFAASGAFAGDSFEITVSLAPGCPLINVYTNAAPLDTTPSRVVYVGQAIDVTFAATVGGLEPYTWDIAAGALPDGLWLGSVSGKIGGTLTLAGTYVFAVRVTDWNGCQGAAFYTLVVEPSAVIEVVPPKGTVAGGVTRTVRGYGFNLATGGVTFDGIAATDVALISNTELTCVVPAHAVGTVDVVVAGVGTGLQLYTYTLTATQVPIDPDLITKNPLPPIPYQSPIADGAGGRLPVKWFQWLQTTKDRIEGMHTQQVFADQITGLLPVASIPPLEASGVTPDSYGDATRVPRLTIGADGRITEAVNVPISGSALSGMTAANVATNEAQASNTAYGDLATVGPSVTLTLTGTVAIIWLSAVATHGAVGNSGAISVDISGASTVAASNANASFVSSFVANHNLPLSRVLIVTGLTPGSTTFTVKYTNDGGGQWNFFNRSIAVYAP